MIITVTNLLFGLVNLISRTANIDRFKPVFEIQSFKVQRSPLLIESVAPTKSSSSVNQVRNTPLSSLAWLAAKSPVFNRKIPLSNGGFSSHSSYFSRGVHQKAFLNFERAFASRRHVCPLVHGSGMFWSCPKNILSWILCQKASLNILKPSNLGEFNRTVRGFPPSTDIQHHSHSFLVTVTVPRVPGNPCDKARSIGVPLDKTPVFQPRCRKQNIQKIISEKIGCHFFFRGGWRVAFLKK